MSGRRRPGVRDPRRLGGSIAGPGGPYDRDAVVVDTRHAVLLDHTEVSAILPVRDGQADEDPQLAMVLAGRISATSERAEVLFLFDVDGAAAIITELAGLAVRIGPQFAERLAQRLEDAP